MVNAKDEQEVVKHIENYIHTGRHIGIIHRREETKSRTLQARRDYDRAIREQANGR